MPSQITRCSHNASVLSKRIHDDLATRALDRRLPLAYIDHPVFFAPLPQPKLGLFDSREACYFLSEDLMSLPYEECFQIALHEAAHAAAFHTTGTLAHDEVFRSWCKALGADEAYSKAKVNMKTRSGLLDKIRKLEALSSSPFAAESVAAMRKVRELMASHKLEDDMEEEEAIYMVDLCPALSRISTRWTMLTAIASMQTGAYLVKVKDGDGYCIRAYGSQDELEVASYLVDVIGRAADKELARLRTKDPSYKGVTGTNSFYYGVYDALHTRFQADERDGDEAAGALMVIREDNAVKTQRIVFPGTRLVNKSHSVRYNKGAYEGGKAFGKDLHVSKGIKKDGSKTPHLLA